MIRRAIRGLPTRYWVVSTGSPCRVIRAPWSRRERATTPVGPISCPISISTSDQVGERWTLHVVLALMSGPKRYSQLKRHLSGAGANILSDRLRGLAANHLVGRSTADSPGSEVTYHLTERGRALAPVVGSLSVWGLSLLMPAPGDDDTHTVFDQTWTPPAAAGPTGETYHWTIDDVEFELT